VLLIGEAKAAEDDAGKRGVLDLLFLAPGITPLTLPTPEPLNFTLEPGDGAAAAVLKAAVGDTSKAGAAGVKAPVLPFAQEVRSSAGAAARSSASLLRALQELRRVDSILQGCSAFWANMDGTVERLAQMKELTERLVGFATSNVRLRERFDQRLGEYADFWASLERLCKKYSLDHHTASGRMQEFVREVADAADLIDTAESARAGVLAARQEQRRQRGYDVES